MFNPLLPFEWIVAIRFLREGRLQTVFIMAGVAIGVAVIVFMSALMAGLQGNFIRRVLSAQAHIELLPPKEVSRPLRMGAHAAPGEVEGAIIQPPLQRLKSIDQWQSVTAQIRTMPELKVVASVAGGSALVVRGNANRAVSVAGVEPAQYFRIVDLESKIVRGRAQLTTSDILIGTELADDLGLQVGDKLRLSTATSASGTDATGAALTLTITGIFDLGNKGANARNTFVALRTAQSLLGLPGGVTSLEVTVEDVYAAERIAQRITAATGVQADSWIKTNAEFFSAVNAQTLANTAIRFFVGLSVAFGIASVMAVVVVQKAREIGILRAMGISQAQIMRLFLLQGGLLGLAGSVAGCLLGAGILVLWQRTALNADGTPLFALALEPMLFVYALLLAMLTGLAAAFAPARRAARLDPVVAIRG
ncbi:FtsX-like permease family protein [Variovorax sp. H27-G14]|uniref:FtsX-like permease family protein n=1 Tax=Variovorax sp. H27-G14 TaxID=3111914 RepID=UPI0038FCB24A